MKLLTFVLFSRLSTTAFAECTPEQEVANIDVEIISGKTKAGGNHGMMQQITILAPSQVKGVPLQSMELTEGEVASFWIPVAFKIDNGIAKTVISGYKESIKHFEIAIYYANEQCNKSVQLAI